MDFQHDIFHAVKDCGEVAGSILESYMMDTPEQHQQA